MVFILSKLLLFLIKPVIWIFALLLIAAFNKTARYRKNILYLAIGIFFLFGNEFLVGMVMNAYQADYPNKAQYDVGIVLGGFGGLNKRNNKIAFYSAGDRLFQAIALYKQGDIKKILLSGGNASLTDNKIKEADLAIDYLKLIGIPDSAILVENQSRNTLENARNSCKIIDRYKSDAKILVITSAWHIPRAKLIFDRFAKGKIEYYPTDFSGSTIFDFDDYIIPSAGAMACWETLLKEWIGLLVDKIRN